MGTISAPVRPISVHEYLSNPTYAHCEFVDGRAVELNVGDRKHSRVQVRCGSLLDAYSRSKRIGYVGSELHCRLKIRGRTRFRLPDVCVVLREFRDDRYLDGAPEFVIEIKSIEDSIAEQFRKIDDYFANGTRLAWVVDPEDKCVFILAPNASVRTAIEGETLIGGDVLPGLSIPVKEIFS